MLLLFRQNYLCEQIWWYIVLRRTLQTFSRCVWTRSLLWSLFGHAHTWTSSLWRINLSWLRGTFKSPWIFFFYVCLAFSSCLLTEVHTIQVTLHLFHLFYFIIFLRLFNVQLQDVVVFTWTLVVYTADMVTVFGVHCTYMQESIRKYHRDRQINCQIGPVTFIGFIG